MAISGLSRVRTELMRLLVVPLLSPHPVVRVPVQSGVVEDPTARLDTSCTRTGRPRRPLLPNQATGRRVKA